MDVHYLNDLLGRIAKGEKDAFDDLFDYYYPRLLKFAKYYVKTYEDSEEVVMDVFVKLLKRKNRLTKIENFNSYVFFAIKNQALSLLNKNRPELFGPQDQEDFIIIDYANPETKLIDQELLQVLRDTVENLPVKRRTVYKLVKEDGLRNSEVAKLLNISKKTVEVHIGLAVNNIRSSVTHYFLSKSQKNLPLRKVLP